ncbi:MAG: ribonuclease VapC [Candidatus Bathyarchaeota archaeon]|nr:ribonuclease VapC [Candidatus Bathyarchaeota archaeon]
MSTQPPNQPRITVLDTSAFVGGFDPFASADLLVTAPAVVEEIRRDSMVKMRFEAALESGKVRIQEPSKQYRDAAEASAGKVGDAHKLSEADMQLLALALQLKAEGYLPQIVTDDYSIQNVAVKVGVEFSSRSTYGIKRMLEWIRYCPACHKQYPGTSKLQECQICGTPLKRKPKRQLQT